MTACPDDGWSFTVEVDATYHPPSSPPTPRPATQPRGGAVGALATAAPAPAEAPPTTDLVPGFIVGEYKIEKKIGEGGMGAVYSAMHPMIGKRAAIKVISTALGTDASAVNRFVQEARSVNQIGHPNIVDVFAFGELPDGRNYFVMEYLQGESLADRIQRASMPLGEAIEILDQVADALEAAHEKQIVHRDLKPDNVYLAAVRGGRTMVKLLDFGIAKLSVAEGSGTGGVQKTRTGMMMGTPGYLSPEQARGKNVDHRTDIYALGCMVFEIVCGRLPFVADNAMDIVLMHMTSPPPRASEVWPEIPAPLDELITRMLEKDANARPTLGEIRAVFSELVTSGLVTLNNGRGVAFGSSIGRSAPGTGAPIRQTPPPGTLALGTHPSTQAPGTSPPIAAPMAATTSPPAMAAPKKKTGLVVALGAVVLLGGGGAFFAIQNSKDEPQAQAKVEPTPTPTPTPVAAPQPAAPEPPKPAPVEEAKPAAVEAPKPQPGMIEIEINVAKAEVTVDGNPVEVKGKKATATIETEGTHTVVVTAAGRETFEKQIEVTAGRTVVLPVKLERARSGSKRPTAGAAAGKKDTTQPAGKGSAATETKPKPVQDKNYTVDPFAQ